MTRALILAAVLLLAGCGERFRFEPVPVVDPDAFGIPTATFAVVPF